MRDLNLKGLKINVVVFTISLLLLTLPVHALILGNVSGEWSNVAAMSEWSMVRIDDVNVDYGAGVENQVRWGLTNDIWLGQGDDPFDTQSGLGFTGNSGTVFNSGEIFEIGQLRHFNRPIWAGTEATQADLTLSFTFSDPAGFVQNFDIVTKVQETKNNVPAPLSDDIITFDNIGMTEVFSYAGIDYVFELLGFGITPFDIKTDFRSPESTDNAILLFGKITTVASPVPEPGTILLVGIGILGIAITRKRFEKK